MNSIDRKILRCQREIEASRPKLMSFEEFEKGNHWLIDTSALTPWAYASSACITEADCRQIKSNETVIPSPPTSDGWNGGLVVGKVYLTSSRDWLTPMFARWTQMGWAAASFRANSAMANRALTNHPDGREVLREATEAELRGES